jgi:hypothetical protein
MKILLYLILLASSALYLRQKNFKCEGDNELNKDKPENDAITYETNVIVENVRNEIED